MCAIFGSYRKSMFEVLYKGNYPRGTWAGSALLTTKNDATVCNVYKWRGKCNIEKKFNTIRGGVYLGHVQAPTSSSRSWSEKNTHPFKYGDWYVAHNGVLTNYKEVLKNNNITLKVFVDSHSIPILIHSKNRKYKNDIDAISETLNELEGTFAVWIYNKKTGNVYVSRQGSTLFADDHGNFSSTNSKNEWGEVPEGKIFKLTPSGLVLSGKFNNKSPFFVI